MSEANQDYVHIPTVYRQLIVEAIEDLNSKTLPERDPSETVWSLRKRIKKMRSLLRLMKGNIGKNFAVSDSLARRTAKRAGVLRDRYVLATTAKKLEQSASLEGLPQEQLEALCDNLEKEIPHTAEAELAIKGATKRLQKLLKLSKPLTKITTEPEQQLERIEALYRRSRRLFHQMETHKDKHIAHKCRRQIKYLWTALSLYIPSNPAVLEPYCAQLKNLSDIFGEHHDFEMLEKKLQSDNESVMKGHHATQAKLRAEILSLGAPLFTEKPKKQMKSLLQ